jgi:uncharacterized protein YecE (DUF72 family)
VTEPPAARVGCAGWSLPRDAQGEFGEGESHLARYATRFSAVEINSSFYRPHRPSTYARWRATVPAAFRFAVKVPRAVTHERRLVDAEPALDAFTAEAGALGDGLGCLLVQLPPSLAFDAAVAGRFFAALGVRSAAAVAGEPRLASGFTAAAGALLAAARVARVAADPARVPAAAEPGGWGGLVYYRLHGSPRTYYSAYAPAQLDDVAARLAAAAAGGAAAWCVFDNTAAGAATHDALGVLARLGAGPATA